MISTTRTDDAHLLQGKVAVVTGASGGLGRAIAMAFAGAGASGLILTGREAAKGNDLASRLTEAGCRAVFVAGDLADVEFCKSVIRATETEFGRIDVLVNAAGTSTRGNLLDTTPEVYDRLFAVNTRAPFFLMQGAADLMRRKSIEGTMVNIASMASHGGPPVLIAYSATKAALSLLTRNAAFSLQPDRIRVNGLNIGWTRTEGDERVHASIGFSTDWLDEAAKALPFGRQNTPEEVAEMVLMLASSKSGLMTGSMIDFDQTVHGCRVNSPPPPRLEA